MIPYSAVQGYSTLRGRIADSALLEVRQVLTSVSTERPAVQREALKELVPHIGDRYVGATSTVAAQFFTELQQMNEIRRPVAADVLTSTDRNRWHSLVDWGAGDYVFRQLGPQMVYSRIAGGMTKTLTEAASDTIIGNAQNQGSMRAQRVPQPGCCAFCGMLASRGAVYSADSAAGVVGRGKPVGSHPLAKGIRPRGSRTLGEDYHDFCRCEVVVVTEGNEVELQRRADEYLESYANAYKQAQEGRELRWKETRLKDGTIKRKHYWVKTGRGHTHQDVTRDILAAMRADLDIR